VAIAAGITVPLILIAVVTLVILLMLFFLAKKGYAISNSRNHFHVETKYWNSYNLAHD